MCAFPEWKLQLRAENLPGETNHLSFHGWQQVDQITEVLKISQVFHHLQTQIQCVQAERKPNKLILKRWAGRRNKIHWSLHLSLPSAAKSLSKLNQIKNLTTKPKENSCHDFDHCPSLASRILSHMKLLKWQNWRIFLHYFFAVNFTLSVLLISSENTHYILQTLFYLYIFFFLQNSCFLPKTINVDLWEARSEL